MKMIKFTLVEGLKFYLNSNYIQGVSEISGITDRSILVADGERVQVKGTPEEIVGMIHEVEGNK